MNEIIFFAHIVSLLGFLLLAVRMGKEALIAAFSILLVTANLFVVKQISLFGLHVTAADVYAIGSIFALSCLQEYYGKNVARQAIWVGFFSLLVVGVMSQFHLFYAPNKYDATQKAFQLILSHTPRILISSFAVALIADRLDITIYGWLKNRQKAGAMALRFSFASLFSQFVDTFLFSFAALYGTVHSLTEIILFSFSIKAICILLMAPFAALTKRVIRAV